MVAVEVRSVLLDSDSSPGALLRSMTSPAVAALTPGALLRGMTAPPGGSRQRIASADCMLVAALSPAGRVDFPTVTEICECVLGSESQAEAVAKTLALALQQGVLAEDLSLQVKVLTVANELLYDANARRAMFNEPGFLRTLLDVRNSRAARVDGQAAECARLFAWEVSKRLLKEFCCNL